MNAKIELSKVETLPTRCFYVQAIPDDDHPYGQWSLAVNPTHVSTDNSFRAIICFIMPDAPHHY